MRSVSLRSQRRGVLETAGVCIGVDVGQDALLEIQPARFFPDHPPRCRPWYLYLALVRRMVEAIADLAVGLPRLAASEWRESRTKKEIKRRILADIDAMLREIIRTKPPAPLQALSKAA